LTPPAQNSVEKKAFNENTLKLSMKTEHHGPQVSIVVPVLNEEQSIPKLYAGIKETMGRVKKSYEIIFVDDGSTDKSFCIMERLHGKDEHVRAVKFTRNFGKSEALSAGFREAQGDVIITMDADLQDDPAEIPSFLEKIKEYDIVVGWRHERKDARSKKLSSLIFNKMAGSLLGAKVHDSNCGFKAFRRGAAKSLKLHGELYRYIPAILSSQHYKIGEIKVRHNPRIHGESKYGTSRLFRGFFDLLTTKFLIGYSKRPFHLFGVIGLFVAFIGFIINLYLSYLWFLGYGIGDRPLLLLGVLMLFTGIQFISIGLLGELMVNLNRTEESTTEKKI
jgi:glycosyltransferase involved in cell wall biosynthesis